MIKVEYPFIDTLGNKRPELVKTYSDSGMMIKQVETDTLYPEAIDTYPCKYNYVETEIPIEGEINTEILEKAQAYDIIMGVSE